MRAEMVREGRESRIAKRSRAVESSERTWLALLALALGGFAIGATEFVAMGLLPSLANDLLPGLYAESQERANAQAGSSPHMLSVWSSVRQPLPQRPPAGHARDCCFGFWSPLCWPPLHRLFCRHSAW